MAIRCNLTLENFDIGRLNNFIYQGINFDETGSEIGETPEIYT